MNIHDLSVFRTPKIYPETTILQCKCCIQHAEIPPGFGAVCAKNLRHNVWGGPLSETRWSSTPFIPISVFPTTPVAGSETPPLSRATTPIITPVLNPMIPTIVQEVPTVVQGTPTTTVQKKPIIIPTTTTVSRFGSLTLEHSEKTYTSQDFRSHARISIDKSESRNIGDSRHISDSRQPGYCNNCGKYGHSFHQCKMPITSYGLIVFRKSPLGHIEYLMIRRRDTLGFIDFMRGKYSIYNKEYILNMIVQMTDSEKTRLLSHSFNEIWSELWGNETMMEQYRVEEESSREKLAALRWGVVLKDDFYTLDSLIQSTRNQPSWEFAEWGFPKGRRNYQEKDYECAVREFCEETGYAESVLVPIQNILPFEEIFTGSNYKSYKHKYYLTYMSYADSMKECAVQSCEVSCAEWKPFEDCLSSIRYYNLEKKRVLGNVHRTITDYLVRG